MELSIGSTPDLKWICISNKIRNNFIHRNFSRFEMDFKLKFRESKV
jgi:hypothetical protein